MKQSGKMALLFVVFFAQAAFARAEYGAERPIAVKTASEFLYSLSASTGISVSDATIRTVYGRVQSRLPVFGKGDEVSDPMMFGLTTLASIFCKRVVDLERVNLNSDTRLLSRLIDYTQPPSKIEEFAKPVLIEDHARLFWGRMPTNEELAVFMEYLSTPAQDDTLKGTADLVASVCTMFATSLEFMVR